jgi:hypothetical protein
MNYISILSSFLPSGLLDHFEITDFKEVVHVATKTDCYYIYLEEKNQLPYGYDRGQYESKGFYSEKIVQDFPIRGKAVYLVLKRRRWRLKSEPSTIIQSDYSFIADGVKLTQEVADFLKGTGRDARRYDK